MHCLCISFLCEPDLFIFSSELTCSLATAARVLEVSMGSARLPSGHDSLTAWGLCCLLAFVTGWSGCISAEDWIWSGISSNRRGLLYVLLLCSVGRCWSSDWILSGRGFLSSGGGSSTETLLATRDDGSTAVTTRVTLRGKGGWENSNECIFVYDFVWRFGFVEQLSDRPPLSSLNLDSASAHQERIGKISSY